jgi:hypothetical protein
VLKLPCGWPSAENRQISSFHDFLSYNYYFITWFKLLYRKNVVMVTLTTSINLSCSLSCAFWCGKIYEGGPRVCRPPIKWSAITEILRNTVFWWEELTFKNVAVVIIPIQAPCRNAFRDSSSLHSELCDLLGTVGVATPGVGLPASCLMLSWGPYLPCSGSSRRWFSSIVSHVILKDIFAIFVN